MENARAQEDVDDCMTYYFNSISIPNWAVIWEVNGARTKQDGSGKTYELTLVIDGTECMMEILKTSSLNPTYTTEYDHCLQVIEIGKALAIRKDNVI